MAKDLMLESRLPAAFEPLKDLFEDIFEGLPRLRMPVLPRAWTPRVNIKETEKEYVITAAIPGVKKEDVKITVEDGVLYITGEHKEEKEEKGKTYLRQEMSYGSFQRSFVLPAGLHPEDVKATQKDGMLTVRLPKLEPPKAKGVYIKVD
jgi:HSP20 family protein